MKRRSCYVRAPAATEDEKSDSAVATENPEPPRTHQDYDVDDDQPASKILKGLLVQEVDKAVRDLQSDPSVKILPKHRAASLIPEFDPESEECTVRAWLKKIEQLGDIHNWDDKTKSFHLQEKLRGQARKWYNRLESYDYEWHEWKTLLVRAFPKHRDYCNVLEEMLNRKKLPTESMTKYYQDKVALCFQSKLSDSASVSCIIKGLPATLQANARAYQCERPDELYEGFLSALDDYRLPIPESRQPYREPRTAERKLIPVNTDTEACPRCKKTGHLLRFCPLPDQRTCYKCGIQGHIAPRCPGNKKDSNDDKQVKDIKLLQNYNEVYKKTVKINGVFVRAYLDTGSQVNVLATQVSQLLSLPVQPTSVVLKGFSGGMITSRGEVQFKMLIDGLEMDTKVFLTDIDMNGVNLLIGQPTINQQGVSLIVRNGSATLQQDHEFLSQIEVAEERDHFKVVAATEECLPPGISIIMVNIVGNKENNDVITPARHYELKETSYSIPATVLRGCRGYMKIVNTGSADIRFLPGAVLTRADNCEPLPNQVSHHDFKTVHSVAKHYSAFSQSHDTAIGGVRIEDISVGPLSDQERHSLIALLLTYKDSFASNTNELGCSDLVQMKINLTTDTPVFRRPYRLSYNEQDVVTSKVRELLNAGIIKESESNFASPVVLVKKKNGENRLCVDYRALNAITVKDRYPLPNIEDQVSKVAGKKYFTSLDMAQSYHQVLISPEDTHKTAFTTPQGHFEYLRVPFGLANAPSVFMRLINKIVDLVRVDRQRSCVASQNKQDCTEILAFLDDILIPSIDIDSGLNLLQSVLSVFGKQHLKLNMKKCAFLQTNITYLGHEISSEGIQPGDLKLTAVSKFPTPQNVHQVRQFIGLCSYFRKFIKNFAILARPLTELTKKNENWNWGDAQTKSFETLKNELCKKPVLSLYDRELPTEIHTDACKQGLGAILLQRQTDNTLRPVLYYSRVTSREESFYHSYELETLAVVEALRRFRVYIVGLPIKIVTDCTAVRATLTKRDLVPRIARWWMLIQDYDISIDYRAGDKMKHVDALSRNPVNLACINRLEIMDWFYTLQYQDEKLKQIIDILNSECASADIKNNYVFQDNRLYRKTLNGNRLVVPNLARWRIVQLHHDEIGHVGLKRCSEIIKSEFWFPKMTRFIKKYVSACLFCAYGKGEYGRKEGKLHPIAKPTEPMKMVHIDHLGPFCRTKKGYQYLFVLTDSFSKFVIAEPTRTVNSVETIRALKRIFSLFGYPERVVSDHGKAFTSRYFKRFATQKQFRHTLNAIACPRANGQVERTNRTLLDALRATNSSETANNWDNQLPDVIWGINNTSNDTTGFKPYDLMFAHTARPVCDVAIPGRSSEPVAVRRNKASRKIQSATEKMKRNYDKRRKNSTIYKKGDLVLWKQAPTSSASKVNTKLDDVYSGPYVISKILGNDRYQIRSIKGLRGYKKFLGIVASDAIRPYRSIAPVVDSASSSDEQLETEDLIDLLES